MPSATFQFYDSFKGYSETVINAATDSFRLMLTNTPLDLITHTVLADLTPVVGVGYASLALTTTWLETGVGTSIWRFSIGADQSWTAGVGGWTPFRYAVIYDDSVAVPVKPLVGVWDYGSALSMNNNDTFTVDVDANFTAYTLS